MTDLAATYEPAPGALRRARESIVMVDVGDPEPPVLLVDFVAFYREHRLPLTRALALTLNDPELAAEAVDEAMTRAFQRWSKVSQMDNAPGWVYRVASNWSLSVLRRVKRTPDIRIVGTVDPPVVADPTIRAALAELDVKQRSVVVCRYLFGWSEAETAAALGIRPGTVKSRLSRATALLRHRLDHLTGEF